MDVTWVKESRRKFRLTSFKIASNVSDPETSQTSFGLCKFSFKELAPITATVLCQTTTERSKFSQVKSLPSQSETNVQICQNSSDLANTAKAKRITLVFRNRFHKMKCVGRKTQDSLAGAASLEDALTCGHWQPGTVKLNQQNSLK